MQEKKHRQNYAQCIVNYEDIIKFMTALSTNQVTDALDELYNVIYDGNSVKRWHSYTFLQGNLLDTFHTAIRRRLD